MHEPTAARDYHDLLAALTASGLPYFLEGGQAVNFWAEAFLEDVPALAGLEPFTSKDCDIWVDKTTLDQITTILDGELVRSESPVDVQVGVFRANTNPVLELDLFSGVYGITPAAIRVALKRSLEINDYRVLDPVFLFQSKCHAFVELDQAGRNDERHLRMLVLVLPAYVRFLLARCVDGEITERQLIGEVKRFRRLSKDSWVRRALEALQRSIDDLLPVSELRNCSMPKLQRYAEQEWPESVS